MVDIIIYNRILKEEISAEDMKRHEVSYYYNTSLEISDARKSGLDDLVSLGYVEKTENDILYSNIVHVCTLEILGYGSSEKNLVC